MTASDSAKPGPHINFLLCQRSRVRVEMGTKSEKVCMVCVCVDVYFIIYIQGSKSLLARIWYGDFYIRGIDAIKFCGNRGRGLGAELHFLGFQIEENFWEAKF